MGEVWAGRAIAAALFAAPVAVVLQNRAAAPIALVGFVAALLFAWRGRWLASRVAPVPPGPCCVRWRSPRLVQAALGRGIQRFRRFRLNASRPFAAADAPRHAGRRSAWPRWPHRAPGDGGWHAGLGGPVVPLLLLVAWMVLATNWAIDPPGALDTALRVGAMLALAVLAARAVPAVPAAPLVAGVALGLAMAGLDAATGNGLRALVRGIAEPPPQLAFGLKNAAAVLALLLPLAVAALRDRVAAVGLALGGGAVVLALPGESAKLALVAGLAATAAARRFPRAVPRAVGAALALAILAAPLLATAVLRPGLDAASWPESAAHRLMVWDFTASRIAEAPVLGHGMEASRALPGGRDAPGDERLRRFGLGDGRAAEWIRRSEILPLHPHNLALQVWLELGAVGAALAAWLAWALGAAAARGPNPAGAAGVMAAGAVVAMLSYGAWQHWWVAALALAAVAAATVRRRA